MLCLRQWELRWQSRLIRIKGAGQGTRQGAGEGGANENNLALLQQNSTVSQTGAYYFMPNTTDALNAIAHFVNSITLIDAFEWTGALIGLLGAFLLATHSRLSRYGWVAFFVANIAMICFAFALMRNGLLLQQIGFLGTSLLGMKRAGLFHFNDARRPKFGVFRMHDYDI